MSNHQQMTPELQALEYYRQQDARRTMMARGVLLTMIFGMLGANMRLTQSAAADMLTNLDQTRLAQVTLQEQNEVRMDGLATEMADLSRQVALLEAQLNEEAQGPVAAR